MGTRCLKKLMIASFCVHCIFKFVQCLMWQDFFDFQFWITTFLAIAREMSNGFLYFCGIWISEKSPMRKCW